MNLEVKEKIRIKLESFDHELLDASCQQIIEKVQTTQSKIVGPIPLPTKKRIYCVLRSPHVDKDSREHFEIRTHKRILEIYSDPEVSIVDLLAEMELDPGVFCSISIS